MEKFRAFLEQLKKYHFWVLCGLIVLISFVTWYLAIGERAKYYAARKSKIESAKKLVDDIARNNDHPSAESTRGVRDLTDGPLLKQVNGAANRLYREQRESNPLPTVFDDKAQQKGFEDRFEKIWAPMEDIEKLPPDALEEFYRQRYRNHIDGVFPKWFEWIERRTEEGGGPVAIQGARGRGAWGQGNAAAGANKPMVGIVDWEDADKKIKQFRDRFSGSTPSTLDIMLAQEELWVYETLLKVIQHTNNVSPVKGEYKKPESHKVARIKQILAIDIGKDAIQDWKNCESALINLPTDSAGAAGQPAMQQAAPQTSGQQGRGSAMPGGPSSGVSPLAGRYIDEKGKPIAEQPWSPFLEFRMMPINLKVVIEQDQIPRLLAECANSAMRIDVRGVRILASDPGPVVVTPSDAPTGGAAPGGAAASGGPTPMGHGGASGMGGLGGQGHGGGGGGGNLGGDFTYTEESAHPLSPPVPVEVQGIIYIYNPPRKESSGDSSGGNAAEPAPNGAAPATPNGASPAMPKSTAAPAPAAPGPAPAAPGPAGGGHPAPISPPAPAPLPAAGTPAVPPSKTTSTGGRS
jgi:hypothetical protein